MAQILLTRRKEETNKQVINILLDSDEITWKTVIFGLIESEQMDPWDIDISIIAYKFLETLKKLTELDFRVSGKIVLASAILLKLKSDKLMDEEIAALDELISSAEEPVDLGFFDEFPAGEGGAPLPQRERPQLVPRTPQPRKRKVSIYDLVEALEHALDVEVQRPVKLKAAYKEVRVPTSHVDISQVIREVYTRINTHYRTYPQRAKRLTFNEIIPSEHKQDKVMTFIPLLHLDIQRKVDLLQEEPFGEIEIDLLQPDADLDELAAIAIAAKS